ncbi:Fic family protein [Flexithrix dorotheae]|uniref:Fic family protein n=1 Tax=Flexithrix dorotheae TaxID=70993 RepID=UPI000367493D|nr:Fic family protein [Flexithrix dorotheae]
MYIYLHQKWPQFHWDHKTLLPLLGRVSHLQGKILGKMELLGFDLRNEASLETLTQDVVKSSEIEGEILDPSQVRSSIAKRLGLDQYGLVPSDRNVDGVVDMMLDATQHYQKPLTKERLYSWHFALFPTGRSGLNKIIVGQWRDDSTGPMQVVSGTIGRERVHFQAPAASTLEEEMKEFLDWFEKNEEEDAIIKAGIVHLWFVTLHPFEDGNGRIARALTDLQLARADGISQRFYSMSSQIRNQRKAYYEQLEKTQKGGLDITHWLKWFLTCLENALLASETVLEKVVFKHRFWARHSGLVLNDRQVKILMMLMEEFKGNLTSGKWAKIAKCSSDTALRDIQDLIRKGILQKRQEGGRSTNYELIK